MDLDVANSAPGGTALKIQAVGLAESMIEVSPIIFEEVYTIKSDPNFVELVKNSQELLNEQKILEAAGVSQTNANSSVNSTAQSNFVGVHLFVMVHGFQGNRNDLRLMKNEISLQHPDAVILLSKANEDKTEGDFTEMGERLASEVKQYILSFCPIDCISKISFIGHSIGGIIIRAALPYLAEFSTKFYTYMSLGSPHLGYMYNTNKLFDAGMWLLKKWRNSKCLTQLSMSDAKNPEDTYLY